jgi:hypothetical protein
MPNIIQSLSETKKKIILSILFLIGCSWLATLLVLNSQNVLYRNQFWFPYRAHFFGLWGQGIESLMDRSMIAGEKLRSDHQRVFSRNILEPSSIKFKMRFSKNSFVDIIFNGNNETFEAIRISSEEWRQPFYFKSKHSGEYLYQKNLQIPVDTFKVLNVTLSSYDGKLKLNIDGRDIPVEGTFSQGKVGFDLSEFSEIWEPVITTKDGKKYEAPFSVPENKFPYFLKNFLIFGILILIARKRFFRVSAFLLLFISLAYIYDYYFYSQKHFVFNARTYSFRRIKEHHAVDPEDVRYRFFRSWYRLIGGEFPTAADLKKNALWPSRFFRTRHCDVNLKCVTYFPFDYPKFTEKSKDTVRILIWGGSFSAGSGVTSLTESYPEIIQQNLIHHFKGKRKIELLNSSRGDLEFETYFSFIKKDIAEFKPDVIYLDTIPPTGNERVLEPMFREIASRVPNVIFQRVPIRYEHYSNVPLSRIRGMIDGGLHPEHAQMYFFRNDFLIQQWVKELGLIFVDPNVKLLSDDILMNAHLFWDPTHLTSYGHKVWGDFLSEHLIQIIESKK